MNSASENRHKNLLRLIEEFGTLEAIAELGGWPHTVYLSQLKKQAPDSKSGKPREIGPATARRLEKACGKPANWMDQDNGKFLTEINNDFVHNNGHHKDGDTMQIKQYDTGGSMGHGVILADQPGIIKSWNVSREWVDKNVRNYSSADNLCIVTGFGPSMRPMFNPGDPLLVDAGVNVVNADGIYFFRVNGEGFVKKLQKVPSGKGIKLIASSCDAEYRDFDITEDMDFQVLGRVIRVWCGTDF